MRIVLDTNILLVSFSTKSEFRWIFDSFINEHITLCVSTDILIMEYEEIITKHMGSKLASTILQIIENAPNVEMVTRFFQWKLIHDDPDDNKFVDCAIAGRADYIVTHDKHFTHLEEVEFPRVQILSASQLKQLLNIKDS
ncbi:MAG: putative toxin-antitoxin system toxin component, PIN family [Ignavibacteriae bacterium]|nr:putative toxin-antitoxin system toxin component, PIN family [Ignavibacteriota bacterium]MCB9214376.1 putative toxin-antitoxin system toxin component, PIN family [Ignavibacteria bacterium]